MEDAYEIGIRLVLENGVSTGIATLRDDLAAYDRALAATTGRLRMATEAGRGLTTTVGAPGVGQAAHTAATRVETEAPEAGQGREREVAVPAPVLPLPAAAVAVPARLPPMAAVPTAARVPQPAAFPALVMPRPLSAERHAASSSGAPRSSPAVGQPTLAAPVSQPGTTPALPGRGEATAAVTAMTVRPPHYAQYAPASPATQSPTVTAPDGADGRHLSSLAPDQPSDRQAPLTVRDLFHPPALNAATSGADPAWAGSQAPPRPAGASAAVAAPAAPVAASAPSGPVQGDVYLDGARVGRWMSDRLARDVDRPQSGVTGFDPRLSPAWPGSLHGT